jgi:hypothetical protein
MTDIARGAAGRKPLRSPSLVPPDQLRAIARRVRPLGHGLSRNPVERFVVERDSLGRELELLAEQAEGTW